MNNAFWRQPAWVCLLLPLTAGGKVQAAPAAHLTLAGPPAPLITDAQRAQLGIRFGPDAPIDFFQAKNGAFYINSAGSLGQRGGPGRPAAWNLHVDSQLTRVLGLHDDAPASGPQDVQTIMTTHAADCGAGRNRRAAAEPGGAVCGRYFDRDYAGGGTYFRCPDNATSVFFYHGENHTAPDGSMVHGGWFGHGVGVFNAAETALTRAPQLAAKDGPVTSQIIGLNLTTGWQQQGGQYTTPPQAHPFNGVPTAIAGADGYLYIYYGNVTSDPAYNPSACHPECPAVARAPVAAFCSAIRAGEPVHFENYYRGGWSQPALLESTNAMGFGAGGPFTPIVLGREPGEHGGTVTFIASRHLYAMTRLYGGGINVRFSADGLNWGASQPLVATPDSRTPYGDPERLLYPKLVVVHDAGGRERIVLTYVLATEKPFWKWAELIRQPLALAGG